MTRIILSLILILSLSCYTKTKKAVISECSDAVTDEAMVMLSEYNKNFYDKNYTGTVVNYYDNEIKRIEWILTYENGNIIKYETFYENGDPKLFKPIKCNSIHGNMIQYMDKGKKGYELEYRYGKKHGTGRSYYANGHVQKQIHFSNDLQDGKQFGFYENGDTAMIEIFKNGIKI